MSGSTKIQWTDATWNPTRGCSRISPGCEHCYAETMAARFAGQGQAFHGYAKDGRWTRKVALIPSMLELPLHWKEPRRIFVNSMSDLFHAELLPEEIGRVFEVMERCPQHTFQVLTKRADVMRNYMQIEYATEPPPPNVWLGVSVENQQCADERIPLLLDTPAAVRFLSCEPLLGPVDLWTARYAQPGGGKGSAFAWGKGVNWCIVGGESGGGARPTDLRWVYSIKQECAAAGVPLFVKQLGARPMFHVIDAGLDPNNRFEPQRFPLVDRKGGDPAEWPADLRVREFPA